MPFSAVTFDALFLGIVEILKPRSFLDIGPGAGKYGTLIKDWQKRTNSRCDTIAVEVDAEYIRQFKLEEIYDSVHNADARNIAEISPKVSGDICILGDFIEHLPKSAGIDLLNYLVYRFRYIFLVIPVDLAQDEWEGHSQEAHVSIWSSSDFSSFKHSFMIEHKFHYFSFMFVAINGNQTKFEERFFIDNQDGHLHYGLPYANLAIIDAHSLSAEKGLLRRSLFTNNLADDSWCKRGNCSVYDSDETTPYRNTIAMGVRFFGLGEIWFQAQARSRMLYFPQMFIRKMSGNQTIEIVNPAHVDKGLYELDLSKLSGAWELIDETHSAVRVIHQFEGFQEKCGIHFRNVSPNEASFLLCDASV